MRPKRSSTASKSASTAAGSATSAGTASVASGTASLSAIVSSSASARRPAIATEQPKSSSASVTARPIPDPAPVTTATGRLMRLLLRSEAAGTLPGGSAADVEGDARGAGGAARVRRGHGDPRLRATGGGERPAAGGRDHELDAQRRVRGEGPRPD